MSLEGANDLIRQFELTFSQPVDVPKGTELYTGIDLGTSNIVLAVVDKAGKPVAGAMRYAQVVKDGLVVDYIGAMDIVRSLKNELEERLNRTLDVAGIAYPPGTLEEDQMAFVHVAESSGFEVNSKTDEPTAANQVLGIDSGVIVDIGGGTTGIAVLEDGQVVYVADEPTGGLHFSLVVAGAYKIPFGEAEELKKRTEKHRELFPVVKPVVQKIAAIIRNHISSFKVDTLYLVGGSSCFTGIEDELAKELKVKVYKPDNPLLATPLGIALSVRRKGD